MSIKQKIYKFGLIGGFFVGVGLSFVSSSPVGAYTCAYSGDNGSGKVGNYELKMEGNGGNCYYMAADDQDNSKKEEIFANGRPTGRYQCTGGTVMHDDGNCWTYSKTYTGNKPTYDDGSEIPDSAYQAACQRQGTYYGSHYNYDPKFNACSAGLGCVDAIGDSGADYSTGGGTGIPALGDCRRVGVSTQSAGDVLGQDPTKAKATECKNAGLPLNPQTHDCDWTQDKCEQKNGGQGKWNSTTKKCDAYSDYANETDCKNNGGEFKVKQKAGETGPDGNVLTEDRWECVKPGTDGSKDPTTEDPDAECLKDGEGNCIGEGTFEEVKGKCGEAKTNIISCGEETGGTALKNVLRIFVIVLSFGVGIAAVGGIAWAAFQYSSATDNESNVASARERIRNIVIGVLLYGFIVAISNWLVPGGIL